MTRPAEGWHQRTFSGQRSLLPQQIPAMLAPAAEANTEHHRFSISLNLRYTLSTLLVCK
jgi:hypothetical protein